ncbi:MAG: Hint domain-containing protein [Deltaproteobacteria bacterium]|nr:Hint domain-containing protein [Deltaproteobacteria bacterium]
MKRLVGLAGLLLLLLGPDLSWARGGGGCLEKGTPIRTPRGPVAVERLGVGDSVWSVDGGRLQAAKVRAVIRVLPEEYLELAAGGTRLRVTPEHPILVAPGEYRQAGFLHPGEKIFLFRDGALKTGTVNSIKLIPGKSPAYNLLVSPGGTFVSGNLVLHNKGCFLPDSPILRADGQEVPISAVKPGDTLWAFQPDGRLVPARTRSVIRLEADEFYLLKTERVTLRVTAEHPFYMGRGTFKTVEALKPGDTVLAFDGKWLAEQRIVSLERVRERVPVYNLQTDQPHTFFAAGVAVHNKGGGCFPAGTVIVTPQGERPIERLAAGDEILAVDPDGRPIRSRVKTILVNKNPLVKIKTPGGSQLATADHPFSLGDGRFRAAGDLRVGDRITRWKEGRLVAEKVRGIEAGPGEGLVFNLEVDEPHTFIAGGLVVHNKGGGCLPAGTPVRTPQGQTNIESLSQGTPVLAVDPEGKIVPARVEKLFQTRALLLEIVTEAGSLRTTADHPLGGPDGGFVTAGGLRPGQEVLFWKDGALRTARVIRTNREERPQPVYNLSVGWPNTFLALGFLAHNKGGGSFRSSGSRSSSGGSGGAVNSVSEVILSVVMLIVVITIIMIVLITIASRVSQKKSENLDFIYSRNQINPKAEKTEKLLTFLSRQDPAVSPAELRKQAEGTFVRLQECWSKRDYVPMGPLLVPDLFTQHTAQLQGLARNHEINRIDDLKVQGIDLVNVRYTEKADQREFTALITASALDYYLDDRSGKFLRGDRQSALFQEFWTFQWLNGRWLLREIEQAGESDILKDENFAEMLTADTLKGIYGETAAPQGQAGPWLEKDVERKAAKIERLLNFLSQTDRLWDRTPMLERVREVFLNVYLARETGDPARVFDDLFPPVAEDLKSQTDYWKTQAIRAEYRNLCVRKVELLLVRNFADQARDEFMVRISAHAQRIIRQGEKVLNEQEYVTPFEEYWTFGRLDGQWKLKELLPPGRGKKAVESENVDEDGSPGQLQWYYRQPRVP